MKQKSTGLRRTASAGSNSRSSAVEQRSYPFFVVCVENAGHLASLDVRGVYKVIKPVAGDPVGMLRVVDNEGEDYLYPSKLFEPVQITPRTRRVVGKPRVYA